MNLTTNTAGDIPQAGAPAAPPLVYVVDDDGGVRTAIVRLLRAEGYRVAAFESGTSFLEQHDPHARGCIILDVSMPDLDGLALQQALTARGSHMPVVFLTGHADVSMSVHAMKSGAFDFLTKPVDDTVLMAAVADALAKDEALHIVREERESIEARLATLTPREREVLTHVVAGRLNKQIAGDLGTVEKTVKVHRSRVMEKMRVRSVAELVRMVERASH